MARNPVDLRIWGKSRGLAESEKHTVTYPLVCHLLDAASMAGAIWDRYLSFGLRRWLSDQLELAEVECRSLMMLLAGIHDIGKACPGFQRQVGIPEGLDPEGECTDHTLAGHLWIGAILQHKYSCPPRLAVRIGEIVGGHHGVFNSLDSVHFDSDKMATHGLGRGNPWGQQRLALYEAVQNVLIQPRFPDRMPRPVQVIACAVVILADWLASRTEFVKSQLDHAPESGEHEDLVRFFTGTSAGAPEQLREAGLVRLSLAHGTFRDEFRFEPNRLQRSLEKELPEMVRGPGMLIITEQTGQGKTEAALFAARILGAATGTAGTGFLLPTMATSNAMERRLEDYLNRRATAPASLNLLHSMAWLRRLDQQPASEQSEEPAQELEVASAATDMLTTVTEWLSGGKKAAFAPVGVGTIDQALLGVLPVRHNAFRMLAFANKTIVVDEIHAFDSYVYELLSKFLAWCGEFRVPVVLMSATLPQHIGRRLAAAYLGKPPLTEEPIEMSYPGWAFIDLEAGASKVRKLEVAKGGQQLLAVDLRPCAGAERGLARLAALQDELGPLTRTEGSAVVVCTTVKEAQQTFVELDRWKQQEDLDVELILLHSNMPLLQREQITDDIVERFGRGKGKDRSGRTVIVSTQVIEQSVDIDMDLVVSDLGPLELLLQRAGRGHRHPENDKHRPKWAQGHRLVVLVPEGEDEPDIPKSWEYVYPRAALIRTQRLLIRQAARGIQVPGQVQELVDRVHTDPVLIKGHEQDAVTARATEIVQYGEAARNGVPRPFELGPIAKFSKGADRIDDELVSTRFNADSVRTLPCFERDGQLYLDAACRQPVPEPYWKDRQQRWRRDDLKTIMEHTVPVNGAYLGPESRQSQLPEGWAEQRQLKYVVLLPHKIREADDPEPARASGHEFYLDPRLGLTIDRQHENGKPPK